MSILNKLKTEISLVSLENAKKDFTHLRTILEEGGVKTHQCNEDDIKHAEKKLGVKFDEDLKSYLLYLGDWSVNDGEETFYGLGTGSKELIDETDDLREETEEDEQSIPKDSVVIAKLLPSGDLTMYSLSKHCVWFWYHDEFDGEVVPFKISNLKAFLEKAVKAALDNVDIYDSFN